MLMNVDDEKGIETKENNPGIANKQILEKDTRCGLNAVYPWEHRYTQGRQKQIKNTLQDGYALHIICVCKSVLASSA